jgi:hypothetical protein
MQIPLWLKAAYTLWLVVWVWHYASLGYDPVLLLWFCYVGLFLFAIALWTESRLLVSWQAVALLLVDLGFTIDVLGRLLLGTHLIGGTEYVFNPHEPLVHRILSWFHVPMPVLLLWAVWRLGYDRRAPLWQTAECWVLLLAAYFFTPPSEDVNWVFGTGGNVQEDVPSGVYLVFCMLVYPLVLYLPTHLLLAALFAPRPATSGSCAPDTDGSRGCNVEAS